MKVELTDFETFWTFYPRRVAKQAAMKAYAKALKMTTAETIAHAAKCYARERAGQDVTFTKHPASWLNAGHWGDYGPTVGESKNNAPASFYAAFTSPEREAWDAYGRKFRGLNYPQDRHGGWFFPTRWPPHMGDDQNAN